MLHCIHCCYICFVTVDVAMCTKHIKDSIQLKCMSFSIHPNALHKFLDIEIEIEINVFKDAKIVLDTKIALSRKKLAK